MFTAAALYRESNLLAPCFLLGFGVLRFRPEASPWRETVLVVPPACSPLQPYVVKATCSSVLTLKQHLSTLQRPARRSPLQQPRFLQRKRFTERSISETTLNYGISIRERVGRTVYAWFTRDPSSSPARSLLTKERCARIGREA